MTDMTNEKLSRAVAERCGWEWLGEPRLWMNPATGEWAFLPNFAESFNACAAPGGPVEWLRARDLGIDTATLKSGGWRCTIFRLGGGWPFLTDAFADTLPRALCLAVMALPEPTDD